MPLTATLTLSIWKPCGENWESMKPAGNGRFCAQCGKNVIDFTQFSDSELLAFFRQNAAPVCGRLRQHQQSLPLFTFPAAPQRSRSIAPLAATLLTLGTLAGQATTPPAASARPSSITAPARRPPDNGVPDTLHISGTITDAAGLPIAGAEIRCGTTVLMSDEQGFFDWKIPELGARPALLQFSYGTLERQVRNYHPAMSSTHFDIRLQVASKWEPISMGDIVAVSYQLPDSLSLLTWKTPGKLGKKNTATLDALASFIRANPGLRLRLLPYFKSNAAAAKQQAETVINYLVEKHGISADRFLPEAPSPRKDGKWVVQIEFVVQND